MPLAHIIQCRYSLGKEAQGAETQESWKLNLDPMSQMHQWLTKKELQHGIKDHETAKLFVDNRIELELYAVVNEQLCRARGESEPRSQCGK
jgi:hypothetical protein